MKKAVVVGAVAHDSNALALWDGMKAYYSTQGVPLDFALFSSFDLLEDALLNKFIDIAWNSNLAFVKTDRRADGQASVLAMRDEDQMLSSKIMVRADSEIVRLDQLKGKRVAFGTRDSVQSAIMPEFLLLDQAKLKADTDYEAVRYHFDLGKHGAAERSESQVLKALRSYEVDAGCISEHTLRTSGARELKTLWTSAPYAGYSFTALPHLDYERAAAFVQVLLRMDHNNKSQRPLLDMWGTKRFVSGDRDGYALIFDAVNAIGYFKQSELPPPLPVAEQPKELAE